MGDDLRPNTRGGLESLHSRTRCSYVERHVFGLRASRRDGRACGLMLAGETLSRRNIPPYARATVHQGDGGRPGSKRALIKLAVNLFMMPRSPALREAAPHFC